jgi:hypothetical protein
MKIIAYKKEGSVRILGSVDGGASHEELAKKAEVSEYVAILRDEDLPDQAFFSAFDIVDGKVVVDIEKAKEIRKDELKRLQSQLVQELAQEYTKALVLGGDAGAIQRRALAVSKATFPIAEMPNDLEELKAYIPEGIQ